MFFALSLVFMGVPALAQATPEATSRIELSSGHADIFHVTATPGRLHLDLREDTTGTARNHAPEAVTLVVKGTAFNPQLAQVPGIEMAGYHLPITQDPQLLWPGWDTLGVAAAGFTAVNLHFVEVSGPGRVLMLGQDVSGKPVSLLRSGALDLRNGEVREQSFPAHTHAHWVFEKPGLYTMRLYASAQLGAGEVRSNSATYSWRVEDVNAVAKQTPESAEQTGSSAEDVAGKVTGESAGGNGSAPGATTGQPAPGTTVPGKLGENKASVPNADLAGKRAAAKTGGAFRNAPPASQKCYLKTVSSGQQARAIVRDDRYSPARVGDPRSFVFALGNNSHTKTNSALGAIPAGSDVWMIGQTQVSGVPWLGANTMDAKLLENTVGAVEWKLTSFSGPGRMEVFTSGNFGQIVGQRWFSAAGRNLSGSVVLPRNTHVHPNWVFDRPGRYRVGITQRVRLKSGSYSIAAATLHFNVGGGGNASSGHFDFGLTVGSGSERIWVREDGSPCPTAGGKLAPGYVAGDGSGAGFGGGRGAALANTGAEIGIATLVFAAGMAVLGAATLRTARREKARK